MAPFSHTDLPALRERFPYPIPEISTRASAPTKSSLSSEGRILEAWAEGYNVGSLIILILLVFCNYRSGRWLHKLILLELILALWHGTFIFFNDPVYGWYLSTTAALLFISYFLHNVVAWLKIRPFLPRWGSRVFIISLLCAQPFWVAEAWSNFFYFNSLGSIVNVKMRPWEALLRDPWWIFTTWELFHAIKKTYGFKLWGLLRINARFGVMLLCMILSIAFLLVDVVVSAAKLSANSGINPYWRFALVFKCASDTIFLDDFKSVLDDIVTRRSSSAKSNSNRRSIAGSRSLSRTLSRSPRIDEINADTRVHTTTTLHSTPLWPTFLSLFDKKRRGKAPKIVVQQAKTNGSQAMQPNQVNGTIDGPRLPGPAHVIYGNINLRASDSERDLIFGRLV
ncbi:Nn.00g044120.m01.CDS01 [Neocucurbitaria sp. VM-36]